MSNLDVIQFLSKDDIIYFFQEEMAYSEATGWIRDSVGLDACIEAPKITFDGEYLLSIFEMAAKYIVSICIRHPFSDGNKRVGAMLFILFLVRNKFLLDKKGERKFNSNALVALALMIAESKAQQKKTMIRLIMQFVSL